MSIHTIVTTINRNLRYFSPEKNKNQFRIPKMLTCILVHSNLIRFSSQSLHVQDYTSGKNENILQIKMYLRITMGKN